MFYSLYIFTVFTQLHFISSSYVITERMGFPITQIVYMPWHLGDPLR